jgi:hypothetical protein
MIARRSSAAYSVFANGIEGAGAPLRPAMDPSPRSHRRLIYIGGALALLAAGRLVSYEKASREQPPEAPPSPGGALSHSPEPRASEPFRHPPSALAELGILTDRSEAELAQALERPALAATLRPELCGDEAACAAVRMALENEHTTTLQVVPVSSWNVGGTGVDESAAGLSIDARASIKRRTRVVMVRVATATSARQLAVRAAFAAAAALAEKIDGLVHDPLLGRIESARDFAAHAVTAPLDGSAFRKDRVELFYQPKAEGVVRIVSAGLSRWGGPDVEAAAVPTASAGRLADIVLGVAEAIANGATSSPLTLTRDDLARARGAPYPADTDLPAATTVAIDLVSVHPEGGDPNDFIARIEPPGGTGPLGYLELAELFFGPTLASVPDEAAQRAGRERAQRALPSALSRWSRSEGSTLLVRLPFEIAGEGGIESMWVEVTRYDARTVTGKLADDPLGATQFKRGDEIARPRSEVEDLDTIDRGDR